MQVAHLLGVGVRAFHGSVEPPCIPCIRLHTYRLYILARVCVCVYYYLLLYIYLLLIGMQGMQEREWGLCVAIFLVAHLLAYLFRGMQGCLLALSNELCYEYLSTSNMLACNLLRAII